MGIAVLAVVILAAGVYVSIRRAEPGETVTLDRPTRAATAAARPVSRTQGDSILRDLRCAIGGASANPIDERVARLQPPPLTVDTALHLLLDSIGRPVPVVHARSVGSTLTSRRLVVAHFTALGPGQAEAIFEDSVFRASAHLLITREGSMKQLVPFDIRAHHAGVSQWNDLSSLNNHSIAIEMENLGMLRQRDGGWYAQERLVPTGEVEVVEGRGWHRFTDAQIRRFFQVSCALRRAYPTLEELVGHEHISPRRKQDPGPAFPFDAMRAGLFPR